MRRARTRTCHPNLVYTISSTAGLSDTFEVWVLYPTYTSERTDGFEEFVEWQEYGQVLLNDDMEVE